MCIRDRIHSAPRIFLSEWLKPAPQVGLTALHWLAYWNDYRAIQFLLSLICCDDKFEVLRTLQRSARGMTALDVAGKHQSDEAAIVMLNFYKENFIQCADLFKTKGSSAYIAGWEKFKP